MKGEIIYMEKIFNTDNCTWFWQINILFETEHKLTLGTCEVKQ